MPKYLSENTISYYLQLE